MTFYFQKILDEGTSNPRVARTFVQWSELLELCQLEKDKEKNSEKKEDLTGIFFDIMKAILAANKAAIPLIEELQSIERDLKEHGLNMESHKATIPSSSQLDNIKVFLKHVNECLKLLAQSLAVFFDQGWSEAKFDRILEYVKEKQDKAQEDWQLVELLQQDADWLVEIVRLRNFDEHIFHKRQKKEPLFTNYVISNDGILIRPQLCNGKDMLTFLTEANQRLFLFSEMLIVSAIELYLPEPIIIEEISVEKRRKECPKRFKHGLGYFFIPSQTQDSSPTSD